LWEDFFHKIVKFTKLLRHKLNFCENNSGENNFAFSVYERKRHSLSKRRFRHRF
jgi:hypothetical protein